MYINIDDYLCATFLSLFVVTLFAVTLISTVTAIPVIPFVNSSYFLYNKLYNVYVIIK